MLFSQVLDDDGQQWFGRDAVPAEASGWRPGDGLLTLTAASLPPDAPRQEYWWYVGMYEEGGRRIPLTNGESQLRVARLKGGLAAPAAGSLQPVHAVFGGAIRLQGYAISRESVSLQWAAVQRVDFSQRMKRQGGIADCGLGIAD